MTNKQFRVFAIVLVAAAFVGGVAFGEEPSRSRAQYNNLRAASVECPDNIEMLPLNPPEAELSSYTVLATALNRRCQDQPVPTAAPAPTPTKQDPPTAPRRRRSRGAYARGSIPLKARSGRIGGIPSSGTIMVENTYATVRSARTNRLEPNCHLELRVDGRPVVFEADNGITAERIPRGEAVEVVIPFTGEETHRVDYLCYPQVCGEADDGSFVCDAAARPTEAGRQFVRAGTRIVPGTLDFWWNRTSQLASR